MQADRKVQEVATGRWHGILSRLGIDDHFLRNKHGECPMCGGKDRYRFDDRLGRGTWICSHCGSGDGFDLLQRVKGWSFREAAKEVESLAGAVKTKPFANEEDPARKRAAVKAIWEETEPVSHNDPVWRYLNRRTGIEVVPACIRFHPALPYFEQGAVEHHPALVALMVSPDRKGVGIHRIYLNDDGGKAAVDTPKKLMTCEAISGAAVRLGPSGEVLGIAEGIETALAASRRFGVAVWSSISSGGMEKWVPPDNARRVIVFGDNDASFTGQASAYALAKKLRQAGLDVDVRIPEAAGTDWADQ